MKLIYIIVTNLCCRHFNRPYELYIIKICNYVYISDRITCLKIYIYVYIEKKKMQQMMWTRCSNIYVRWKTM